MDRLTHRTQAGTAVRAVGEQRDQNGRIVMVVVEVPGRNGRVAVRAQDLAEIHAGRRK